MSYCKPIFLTWVFSLFAAGLFAQIPNDFGYIDFKAQFPDKRIIVLEEFQEDVLQMGKNGPEIVSNYREKILFLSNEVQNFAERNFRYNSITTLENLSAICYYPEKGKYKKEKVTEFSDQAIIRNNYVFFDDTKARQVKFTKVREGAVTEITYTKRHTDPYLLHGAVFSNMRYNQNETYQIKVSPDFEIVFKEFFIDSSIVFSEFEDKGFRYYRWSQRDFNPKPYYGDDDYYLHYLPHIFPYIVSYTYQGESVEVLGSVDKLYSWYYSLLSKVKPVENEVLKQLSDSLTRSQESDDAKAKSIFNWVQNNIKYIAFSDGYGGFIPRNPDDIYDKRFGDCKDMSTLLVSLLTQAGLNAYHTWVGTDTRPYSYYELPTPQVDNHMIATYINAQGERIFLDATDNYLEFGFPSAGIQGKEVLIGLSENQFIVDTVHTIPPEKNAEDDKVVLELEGTKLQGKGELELTGYLASDFKRLKDRANASDFEKKFAKAFYKGSNKYKNESLEVIFENEPLKARMNYTFSLEDYVKIIDEEIYINMNLSKQFSQIQIDKKQNIPYFNEFQNYLKKDFFFNIPDGYELVFLPESKRIEIPELSFELDYKVEENGIRYTFEHQINVLKLPVERVSDWNKNTEEMLKQFDQVIILKKKAND